MEPDVQTPPAQGHSSIIIALLVIVIFALLAYIAYGFISQPLDQEIPALIADRQEELVPSMGIIPGDEIVSAYENSKFKVVRVIRNPVVYEDTHYNALYVVGQRGINDSGCGSAYGSETCYFFLESNHYGVPPITYVGSWSNGINGFADGKFKDEYTISFTAWGSDAGTTVEQEWELDLRTGSTTRISSVARDLDAE